jgi:hypothetical protein
MSAKSKLYELIQLSQNDKYPVKLGRPVFAYADRFVRNTNTHNFTCVAVIEIDGETQEIRSDSFTSKKDANQNACEKIYNQVTTGVSTDRQIPAAPKTTKVSKTVKFAEEPEIMIDKYLLILIDYENVSVDKEIEKLMQFLTRVSYVDLNDTYEGYSDSETEEAPIEVIKFAGHSSSMKAKADIVVRSTRKDAVDHYIGFYLGKRIGANPDLSTMASIHVLSRDHFASCLEDFCPNIVHNVDVDDLIDSIRQMSSSAT